MNPTMAAPTPNNSPRTKAPCESLGASSCSRRVQSAQVGAPFTRYQVALIFCPQELQVASAGLSEYSALPNCGVPLLVSLLIADHSHSIVAGGFPEMSKTTREMPVTS